MEIMAHTPVSVMMAKPIETLELLYSMICLSDHCSIMKMVVILLVFEFLGSLRKPLRQRQRERR